MSLSIIPVIGIPEVTAGDDVAALILEALRGRSISLEDNDVVVVTHKIVSKAEGAVVALDAADEDFSYRRLVEDESTEIIRRRGDLVIAQTKHGFICANAGVDRSNAAPGTAVLLPRDPDKSAHSIRRSLMASTGVDLAVIISDTFGRAWRRGLVDVAIGISGMDPIADLKGTIDASGRELSVSEIAVADEAAAAADLVMGKAAAIPAAILRGLPRGSKDGRGTDLIRPAGEDLFR
jgi:coenzyme F420-0:L-glutamate ligase/coenzyme F420-1:gamma-L-glutamate ligase